ncbi:hypothetical protein Bca4012_030921 [Brassica carinata]
MDNSVKARTETVLSVKMWPPSKSTRLMLVDRMTNNLTTPSIFTRKYGLLTQQEAEEDAKRIEDLAFAAANKHFQNEPDGDGTSAVQIYAKESSKLMLEAIKQGPKEDSFFGSEAAKVAVSVLSSIKHQLTEVDLSDFVAGRPEAEALQVMNMFSSALEGSKLRFLDLSDNALGEKGIRAFASLIKSQRDLEELYLMNDGISEDAARAVRDLLPSTAKIRDFRCSSTRIGSEGGVALAEALESCSRLKKLDLRDNMFGVQGGIALAQTLSVLTELTEIYMRRGNRGALVNSAPSLRVLELAGNDITLQSTGKLAACIASKQCLSKLNLSENELKDEGTILIAKALDEGHDQLTEVDLSTNMMRRAGARALAQTVLKKHTFKLFNINGNFISEEGVDEVNDMFKDSPEKLGLLDDNDPDGEDEEGEEEEDSELEAKLGGLKIKQEEE